MKTIKLSRTFLTAFLSLHVALTTISAEPIKYGSEKNEDIKKSEKTETEKPQNWKPSTYKNTQLTPKRYNDSWSQRVPEGEYKRGTIATH